jgi:hypothetical protein
MQKLEPFSITLTRNAENIAIEVPLKKICLIHGPMAGTEGSFIYISEQADPVHVKETIEEIKKLMQPTYFFSKEEK